MTENPLNRATPYLFLAPAGIILLVALLYPIGFMIYASFLDWAPSQRIEQAEWVGLKNYIDLLQDENFRESFSVTITFASLVVSIEMIVGVGLALLLDRNLRGMSMLRTIFILPIMIAPIVVGLMWRHMYHPTVGIFNKFTTLIGIGDLPWLSDGTWAFAAIIIADVWQWSPFVFILSLAALQSLPRSTLEAAEIDGATGWQKIWHIKIPLMMPVLIVTALLRLIDAFKVLEVILVMTNGGPGLSTEIIALRISRTVGEFQELGVAAAMANYLLLLLLTLTFMTFAYSKIQAFKKIRQRQVAEGEN